MKNAEEMKSLLKAMHDFSTAYTLLKSEISNYEWLTEKSVNDLPGFTESYPFDKSFDELDVSNWVTTTVNRIKESAYKVLNYEYLNTGGNCMVGISEVWLPDLKQTVFAFTNEEGCTLSAVDYIRNEIGTDDYDELIIDYVDWGRMTGNEKYFELYRHCLNEYTKSDSKYFGYSREIPYFLLSDELQEQCPAEYLEWLKEAGYDGVDTNGEKIIIKEFYQHEVAEVNQLEAIKEFQKWHDTTAGREEYYSEDYILSFAGKKIELPFIADVWDAIDHMLTQVIESY